MKAQEIESIDYEVQAEIEAENIARREAAIKLIPGRKYLVDGQESEFVGKTGAQTYVFTCAVLHSDFLYLVKPQ